MKPDPERLDLIKNPAGAELFVGLVGPVGVNLKNVQSLIDNSLKRLNYRCVDIKLSDWISKNTTKIDNSNDFTKLKTLMLSGSDCRKFSNYGSFLAIAALEKIWDFRKERSGVYEGGDIPKIQPFTCYFFNQLKHPDEVKILRWIYGNSFYLVGANSKYEDRLENLHLRIENTSNLSQQECDDKAQDLINLDYAESGNDDFGQNIQKTFPLADVFFNETSPTLAKDIDRFVDLMFSNPFHTPTKDEQGMCLARTASLRSGDLARQIGAAITTSRGEVIAIGCNEAARPEGGQYWSDDSDTPDERDYKRGYDSNDRAKSEILKDLLDKLKAELGLPNNMNTVADAAVARKNKLSSAMLFDVIEYFRSVHAEMAALIDAARRGISVRNATMYATTFPCHECAKHIVAAGIPRVIYVEPYPKSRALELFNDAIVHDGDQTKDKRTTFETFSGIAPRKYADVFELGSLKRKDSAGNKLNWTYKNARLRRSELETTYVIKEAYYIDLYKGVSATVKTELAK